MTIQSVDRALEILGLFTPSRLRLGISDISRLTGLARPTVHGIVQTLAGRGFLDQDPETRKYALGLTIYELGTLLSGSLSINQVGAAPAQRLARASGRMVRLAIWDRDTVIVTLNIVPETDIGTGYPLGPRVPAYCTAIGKSILLAMTGEEVRSYLNGLDLVPYTETTRTDRAMLIKEIDASRLNGYAVDEAEYLPGFFCIAAPVFDRTGRPVGAVSISGDEDILQEETRTSLSRRVMATAAEISRSMGYTPEPGRQSAD